jgi:hypothetical protein
MTTMTDEYQIRQPNFVLFTAIVSVLGLLLLVGCNHPVELKRVNIDGVDCVTMVGDGGRAGLSCDWNTVK